MDRVEMEPLSAQVIDTVTDNECARTNRGFERVDIKDAMLYGIMNQNSSMTITFYVSYSTWDGRFLYVDEVTGDQKELESGLKVLARIAIALGCSRLTWQYLADMPMIEFTTPPEVLEGWLTLHWSAEEIKRFLGEAGITVGPKRYNDTEIRAAFETTLAASESSNFRLRLATEDDLDAISRLVQGLAVYEKEPDAVHVTKEHYRRDGFSPGQQPLFYCILLDAVSDASSKYTCGMAFCYIARKQSDGLFLYLEDLFIEEKYRGGGAGMMTMKALAELSLSLNCCRMVWQALDWNTPALNFYNKLGAKVVVGLTTARFAGDALESFGT